MIIQATEASKETFAKIVSFLFLNNCPNQTRGESKTAVKNRTTEEVCLAFTSKGWTLQSRHFMSDKLIMAILMKDGVIVLARPSRFVESDTIVEVSASK